ncbi:UDP-N-acetylmuramate dehydrogenase [Ningiella sp. W23]|uniref:UDP-N-acetylmuramate dehydrogenase n=1 Tax=Ningiella sp. W23 TaxID=3023715 RepID=UPI00375743C4
MKRTISSNLEEFRSRYSGHIELNVNLATLTYWKIGGVAACVISPSSEEQVVDAIRLINELKIKYLIIGDTSNLLFENEFYNYIIIKFGNDFSEIKFNDTMVQAQAGVWVPELAYQCYRRGLTGFEHTCGIPGRVGGLLYMNGGSQRKAIGENAVTINTVTTEGDLVDFAKKDLNLSYRYSPFQEMNHIILGASFKLAPAPKTKIRKTMLEILSSRRKKFPRKQPNCGSVFVSNPKMYSEIGPPGFAIEKVGLKGTRRGGAEISPLHANFIVNRGDATANDVLYLIHLARNRVYEATNYLMDCEVRLVSTNGEIKPAHTFDIKDI